MTVVKHPYPQKMSNIQRLLTHGILWGVLMGLAAWPATAQALPCTPPAPSAPAASFEGVILSYANAEGVRALRATVSTTYFIAFDGANVTAGGTPSPDGRFYAVPHGSIQAVTLSDVRYVIQELRVISTEAVPRIVARVPWQASFPIETRFAPTQGIPSVLWLDSQTLAFPSGSINDLQVWQVVEPFGTGTSLSPQPALAFQPLSPDLRRGLKADAQGWAVYDLASQSAVGRLPRLSNAQLAAWSPDSARLAALTDTPDGVRLALFWRGGAPAAEVESAERGVSFGTLRWSPDSGRLAYARLDPQTGASRLMLYDVAQQTITDTCLDLRPTPDSLAWSPDGARLAVLPLDSDQIHAYDPLTGTTQALGVMGDGGLLGWYADAPP